MAITKQFLKTKPVCKVTFSLSPEEAGNANTAALLGDYNNWEPDATPMKKQKNGTFSVTLSLPVGSTNKFRYLLDGTRWINDPTADGYEFCSFAGGENFLVTL